MASPADWITLAEAAEILEAANVHFRPETIGRWARTGRLQSIKLGGRRFVRRGEVRALVAAPRRVRADGRAARASSRIGRAETRSDLDPAAVLERVLGYRRVARILAVLDTFGKAPGGLLANGLAFSTMFASIPTLLLALGPGRLDRGRPRRRPDRLTMRSSTASRR